MVIAGMKKRADLQGLRAIAVTMVIAYHLDPALLPGGFIGVDVFFVLSGFLIAPLIFNEFLCTGSIDLPAFWTRRIKRLLPNALLTLGFILFAAAIFMPAYRWPSVSEDVRAAAIFLSNFHFADSAVDYFRQDDPHGPVLHFWSLSIEEQFYIALPLVVFSAARFVKRPLIFMNSVLALTVVVSFALSIYVMRSDLVAAFFHTETRVWQLAAGGLLGINFDRREIVPAFIRSPMAWGGAALIAFSAVYLDDSTLYPGFYALIPTLGALALIGGLDAGGFATPLRSLMSMRLLCWIGDRSYSLYLWHWPIIVFGQLYRPFTGLEMVMAMVVIIAVSSAAYSWVERPVHLGNTNLWRSFTVPSWAVMSIAVFCGIASLMPLLPQRERAIALTNAITVASKDFGANYPDKCHLAYDETALKDCAYGAVGSQKKVVLLGDSHAAQWFTPLNKAAKQVGWEFLAWTKTTCPWADAKIWHPKRKAFYTQCDEWREAVIERIIRLQPDLVMLGQLSDYDGYLNDGGVLKGHAAQSLWRPAMLRTLDRFAQAGVPVAVIVDNPKMYRSFRDCIAAGFVDCGRARGDATRTGVGEAAFLHDARPQLKFFNMNGKICGQDFCPAMRDGQILYQDSHHVTASFAERFTQDFIELLNDTAIPPVD